MQTLYNRNGRAVAYITDNGYVYLYSGKPGAWLSDDSIYAYSGSYLGWFQNGWFWDRRGCPAFFTTNASSGPMRPARQARPARGARGARPARGAREPRPPRPARTSAWSDFSDESFFKQ